MLKQHIFSEGVVRMLECNMLAHIVSRILWKYDRKSIQYTRVWHVLSCGYNDQTKQGQSPGVPPGVPAPYIGRSKGCPWGMAGLQNHIWGCKRSTWCVDASLLPRRQGSVVTSTCFWSVSWWSYAFRLHIRYVYISLGRVDISLVYVASGGLEITPLLKLCLTRRSMIRSTTRIMPIYSHRSANWDPYYTDVLGT